MSLCLLMPSVLSIGGFGELGEDQPTGLLAYMALNEDDDGVVKFMFRGRIRSPYPYPQSAVSTQQHSAEVHYG